jgi:hypothetical protein
MQKKFGVVPVGEENPENPEVPSEPEDDETINEEKPLESNKDDDDGE